ncbi:MAG: ribbon-helix-helix protein, CopG family [Rudaea sp.]
MTQEQRTARLTVLVDPDKKAVFEELCAREDVTPSQVIRRLIREYIEQRLGHAWKPGDRLGTRNPLSAPRRGRGEAPAR